MSDRAIEVISRRAADALSRRGSLLALGGLALAAAMPASTAKADKNRHKHKHKKKKKNNGTVLCQGQVAPCQAFFSGLCMGDDDCVAEFVPCCAPLATCNSVGLLDCLFSCGCPALDTLVANAQQQP